MALQKRIFVGGVYFGSEPAELSRQDGAARIFPRAPRDFIRVNLSCEINSSQNSIQSRQYCAALDCGNAAGREWRAAEG
jgi:hypothetical protein